VSVHGVYRFQVRVRVRPEAGRTAASGLTALSFKLYFENGIMSLPPLFAGRNALRLRVGGVTAPAGPVTVSYEYETAGGVKRHTRALEPAAFVGGEARYTAETPGLTRCRSVSISY
jgi:hypothetical protein